MPPKSFSAVPGSRQRHIVRDQHPLLQGPQEINSQNCLAVRKASKMCLTEFTQRIMSGKLLQLREHQSQLNDALRNLHNAKEENKALNRLIKRQEVYLRKFEGENAGLPRLVRAHTEEVRTLRQTVHQLRTQLRDVTAQLQEKDTQVTHLREALAKLRMIVDDRGLMDIVQAGKKMRELEALLGEQKKEIQTLTRRLLLESKNHERALAAEAGKHRETRNELENARETVARLEKEKRSTLHGYTTSHRPIQHQCTPPANQELTFKNKKPQSHNCLTPLQYEPAANHKPSKRSQNFEKKE